MAPRRLACAGSGVRIHGFALYSGIGWLGDFSLFTLLAYAGVNLYAANMAGATCAVTFVFVATRKRIFLHSRTPYRAALAAYLAWNVVAILLASLAVGLIGRLLLWPAVVEPVGRLLALAHLGFDPRRLVPPAAKIAVTPVTMYFNYLAMGVINERRFSFI